MASKLIPLFLILLTIPAASAAQEAKTAIEKGSKAWEDAYNGGDASDLAALYAKDTVLLPPDSDPVEGRQAIEGFWRRFISENRGVSANFSIREILVMGDMAVEVGTYVSTGPDDELVGGGKYLLVWKKMDTGWKISYDIFNSSM